MISENTSKMNRESELISSRREAVKASYDAAVADNHNKFLEGDDKATFEYVFENQRVDAFNIVNLFYTTNCRVVSIQKKTKVGADGLMIEIAKHMTTHNDDSFVVNFKNVRIITGMSNVRWELDMKNKTPSCFKDKIFHHGKLSKSDLVNMRDGLIIIDEIDSGDKELQVLHNTLNAAEILDVEHMKTNNNRFVFISATMIRELYDLYRWGDLHTLYKMTIPASYIGHNDFLDLGIVQEFYSLDTIEKAEKWVKEDIIDHYGTDFRVHIVRVNETQKKNTAHNIRIACKNLKVSFKYHTSTDCIPEDEINQLFNERLTVHTVIGVKNFYRRANLIPNRWKLLIGATHELHTKKVDYNVQVQGLTGRMTGYWRDVIENGHKTGPHRTSIKAIEEYEEAYNNPFGNNSYQTAGFTKKNGKIVTSSTKTMVNPKNIKNLEACDLPTVNDPTDPATIPIVFGITEMEYKSIKRIGKRNEWDYSSVLSIIHKYKPEIVSELDRIKDNGGKDQIVEPDVNATTYGVYITEFVKASRDNRTKTHNGNIKDKTKDTFQIYLDKVEHRIIINIYYGSRTIKDTEEEL